MLLETVVVNTMLCYPLPSPLLLARPYLTSPHLAPLPVPPPYTQTLPSPPPPPSLTQPLSPALPLRPLQVVYRGLRDRMGDTKRRAARIVGNMCTLINDPKVNKRGRGAGECVLGREWV